MNEQTIFNFLVKAGMTKEGAAGLMGNLRAESAYIPTNLQNSYENKPPYYWNDSKYTLAVDNGTYGEFATDRHGYGLAQWTSAGRKQNLLNYKNSKKVSIGDLTMQLEFLVREMKNSYKAVWNTCVTSHNIKECSDIVLHKFEAPKDQSSSVENVRYKFAQEAYVLCAGGSPEPVPIPIPQPTPTPSPSGEAVTDINQLSVGEVVNFTGTRHYSNSKATSGSKATKGPAKITQIAKSGTHPVHLIHTDKTSNVYGWVNLKDITK